MKTALLVIDYINGIAKNGSCKEYASQHPILDNTNKLIAKCRNKNIPIYFIRLAFDDNYSNLPKHSKLFNSIKENSRFKLGSDDVEFVSALDINEKDIVINKTATSPFCGNDLMQKLKNKQIEKLIFAGVATDNAINIGTREAHDAGFYTVIAKDTCGAATEDFHHWALVLLDKIANDIITVDEIEV